MQVLGTSVPAAPQADGGVETNLLKKALEAEQETTTALLQSLPQPGQVNAPSAGHSVDVYA